MTLINKYVFYITIKLAEKNDVPRAFETRGFYDYIIIITRQYPKDNIYIIYYILLIKRSMSGCKSDSRGLNVYVHGSGLMGSTCCASEAEFPNCDP